MCIYFALFLCVSLFILSAGQVVYSYFFSFATKINPLRSIGRGQEITIVAYSYQQRYTFPILHCVQLQDERVTLYDISFRCRYTIKTIRDPLSSKPPTLVCQTVHILSQMNYSDTIFRYQKFHTDSSPLCTRTCQYRDHFDPVTTRLR